MIPSIEGAFEPVARGFYLEGLLTDGDNVWYTDVARGGVRRVGSDETLLETRTMIGGLLMNADGALLVAGEGGIAWVNPETQRSGVLVDGLSGVNEMRPDGHGGILFGTVDLPAIRRGERPGPAALYRLSKSRELTLLRDDLAFTNGFEISADGTALYLNETFVATWSFPLDTAGRIGEPRKLVDKYDCDGMALDAEGNLWVTGFGSDYLLCLHPDGSIAGRLNLPGTGCTNIRFGGPELRDIYVTIVDAASASALAEGRPLAVQNSTIFRARSPVRGTMIGRSFFTLN